MHFTGTAACPTFVPNRFKKDVCQICQSKIQSHSSATSEDILAALEFSVDKGERIPWDRASMPTKGKDAPPPLSQKRDCTDENKASFEVLMN